MCIEMLVMFLYVVYLIEVVETIKTICACLYVRELSDRVGVQGSRDQRDLICLNRVKQAYEYMYLRQAQIPQTPVQEKVELNILL